MSAKHPVIAITGSSGAGTSRADSQSAYDTCSLARSSGHAVKVYGGSTRARSKEGGLPTAVAVMIRWRRETPSPAGAARREKGAFMALIPSGQASVWGAASAGAWPDATLIAAWMR